MSAVQFAIHKEEYRSWMKKSHDAFEPTPNSVLAVNASRWKLSKLGMSERKIKKMVRTITRSKFNGAQQVEMNRAYYYYLTDCKLSNAGGEILSFKKASPEIIDCLDSPLIPEIDPLKCIEQAITK